MIRPLEACKKQCVKCPFLCIFCDGDFAEGSDTAVQFLASLRIHSTISISISSASEFHLTMLLPKRFLQDSKTAYPAPSAPPFRKGEAIDCPACARRAAPVVQHEAAQLVPPWIRAEVDWRRQHTEVSRSGNGWHIVKTHEQPWVILRLIYWLGNVGKWLVTPPPSTVEG